ncbi:MAG: S8 family peptidase [Dehalococcoidia bacterium]|nr:S8 family peptidase [Dehalococcoidia bacterium]
MVEWLRRLLVVGVLLAILVFSNGRALGDGPPTPTFSPGHILVKLRPGAALPALSGTRTISQIGVISLPVPAGRELETAGTLRGQPDVEFAEPDYIVTAFDIPNDPLFAFYQWNLRMVRASDAWDIEKGSPGITIAVLDTGVDLVHPDLAAKILTGLNVLDPNAPPQDDNGHGSHVAGIAAAVSNNSTGIAGISWGAKILPVKVLNSFGIGTVQDLALGILWAADQGAQVMNVSSGAEGLSQTLKAAVDYAHDVKGVLIASSVGNDGGFGGFNPPYYPSAFPNVVGVAATDSEDRRAQFSERGPFVAVAAPGVTIVSSVLTGRGASSLGGDYAYMSGTSMASPHVAGLAALVWSANRSLTNDQVATLIEMNAVDLGPPGKDDFFGYGRIDASAATRAAASGILSASPASLEFLSDLEARQPVTQTLTITNQGGQPLDWTRAVSPGASWLNVAQPSGHLGPLSSQAISIRSQPEGIASTGDYTASVVFSGQGVAQNGPITVTVGLKMVDRLNRLYFPLVIQSNADGW